MKHLSKELQKVFSYVSQAKTDIFQVLQEEGKAMFFIPKMMVNIVTTLNILSI